jgi:ribosomal protein S12 methylthiotransferase
LGCPKTLVDSEVILGKLSEPAYEFTPSVDDCDIALLNTCTFIQDAQAESVNRILELIELKKKKKIKALVVMGCLVQRFPEDLRKELKEVDAFIGSGITKNS